MKDKFHPHNVTLEKLDGKKESPNKGNFKEGNENLTKKERKKSKT